MSTSATSITVAEILDYSAVLMNDPAKTDYTHTVMIPFLVMALGELSESLADSQNSPSLRTTFEHTIDFLVGNNALYPLESIYTPHYPGDLVEIQEIGERRFGSNDPFIPLRRVEFMEEFPAGNNLNVWSWENQIIRFNPRGATRDLDIQIKYIRDFTAIYNPSAISAESIIAPVNSRSFLTYKTASLAAQFIGENPERAGLLEAKAVEALERIQSISNKGRQQMMTRHRPFRSAWKMRGGY